MSDGKFIVDEATQPEQNRTEQILQRLVLTDQQGSLLADAARCSAVQCSAVQCKRRKRRLELELQGCIATVMCHFRYTLKALFAKQIFYSNSNNATAARKVKINVFKRISLPSQSHRSFVIPLEAW
jgi:hypothetical protein